MKSSSLQLLISLILGLSAFAGDGKNLIDKNSFTGWTMADGSPVQAGKGWEVVDGVIHRVGKAGDLVSTKEYGDFELEWEWKISPGGNSGVKYRVMLYHKEMLGPEYQMLDDGKHYNHPNATHITGCIYNLFPVIDNKPLKPVGEWNHSKISAKGGKYEHWLNGTKVAECDTATQAWQDAVAKSKFKRIPNWGANAKGKILLQDHGNEVWFKNMSIREF